MSNLVVWALLGGMILEVLERLGEFELASEVESERHYHPLVEHVERGLSRLFAPAGGLSCPELKRRINEVMERDPKALYAVVSSLVYDYIGARRRRRVIRGTAWRTPLA